jgi:hypothetical protein
LKIFHSFPGTQWWENYFNPKNLASTTYIRVWESTVNNTNNILRLRLHSQSESRSQSQSHKNPLPSIHNHTHSHTWARKITYERRRSNTNLYNALMLSLSLCLSVWEWLAVWMVCNLQGFTVCFVKNQDQGYTQTNIYTLTHSLRATTPHLKKLIFQQQTHTHTTLMHYCHILR